jgi:hypothetical protein
MAIPETSVELSFVKMEGCNLPHSFGELIRAPWGWQVELFQVPPSRCPLARQVGAITLQTLHGDSYAGTVIADLVAEEGGFVLLSGIGHLRQIASTDAA